MFHSETILLTPLISDFFDILWDYFLCGFFIPILGLMQRKPLYLTVLMVSTIFIDGYKILILLILIIEFNIFFKKLTSKQVS